MKQIFGLYGTSNVGKSETIKNVYRKLTEKYPDFIFQKDFKQIIDRKSTRLNSSHRNTSRMPSSA